MHDTETGDLKGKGDFPHFPQAYPAFLGKSGGVKLGFFRIVSRVAGSEDDPLDGYACLLLFELRRALPDLLLGFLCYGLRISEEGWRVGVRDITGRGLLFWIAYFVVGIAGTLLFYQFIAFT